MGPMKKSLPSLQQTHWATLEGFRERQADLRLRGYDTLASLSNLAENL
jgi:hypothetical protein